MAAIDLESPSQGTTGYAPVAQPSGFGGLFGRLAGAFRRPAGQSASVAGIPNLFDPEYLRRLAEQEHLRRLAAAQSAPPSTGNGGGGAGGGPAPSPAPSPPWQPGQNVFKDPATVEWEALLRRYVGKLTNPYEAPDYQAMLKNLRLYAGQLRQPGYTPNERDLIQTGSIDPLAQARDDAKQRAITHLAARGISPGSGPAVESMNEIDRQFAAQDASIRADFARQAVARDASRAQQAAQLDILLPQLETQQFGYNEGRFGQGVESMFQIPQLADRRLGLAMQMLGLGGSPGQFGLGLAQLGQQNQQFSQQQQDAFWRWLASLIPGLV